MAALHPTEFKRRLESDPATRLFDLRDPEEYATGTLPGAASAPYSEEAIRRIADEVDRSGPVALVCGWGHKALVASIALRRAGIREVVTLSGGLEAWGLAGLPVVR